MSGEQTSMLTLLERFMSLLDNLKNDISAIANDHSISEKLDAFIFNY